MLAEELIPHAGLEDDQTEYKHQLNRDDMLSWLKTVAGFANADGGNLYVGVDDETHILPGLESQQGRTKYYRTNPNSVRLK